MSSSESATDKTDAIVLDLEQQIEANAARLKQIGIERRKIGYDIFVNNDAAAKKLLSALNAEEVECGGKDEALAAALVKAKEDHAAALQAEAVKEDKRQAGEVRKQLVELLKTAERADKGLAMLVESSGRIKEICYALNALGCNNPNHHQVEALGYLAVCSALGQTVWGRRFDPVPPLSRTSFGKLTSGWAQSIDRNIRIRLGEPEPKQQPQESREDAHAHI
jgi:hypothetical protein